MQGGTKTNCDWFGGVRTKTARLTQGKLLGYLPHFQPSPPPPPPHSHTYTQDASFFQKRQDVMCTKTVSAYDL